MTTTATMMTTGRHVPVEDRSHLHAVRRAATRAAAEGGLSDRDTAACELAATELATNLIKHARGGHLLVNVLAPADARSPASVQLVAVDDGPGIPDVPGALADGHSTAGSLGVGLGTCRRAAADFDVYSPPGRGTAVLVRVGPPAAIPPVRVGGVLVPHPAETVSGDGWCVARRPSPAGEDLVIGLVDGLGHGPAAAAAAAPALTATAERGTPSAEWLAELDARLRSTRGAAVAVARIAPRERSEMVEFAGVGNIGAWLGAHPLLSRPGVVGAGRRVPPLRQDPAPWSGPDPLVMSTDGIGRYDLARYPAAQHRHPALLAALLWRDARRSHDDATAVVASHAPWRPW
ncbi:anti-sigma regulatory factor [Actinomadura namibiensis]|uniref:Anti-sigma regulatory factor (Ser/Thr protein kinase) n=1 Tax=Actinomadura namibiensis TaxID=182080 RepID=A0A7W3QIS8_ACTNM|nr:anti-sigma regulatory factor [Actinomadura namibiensis]MBA8948749.1 anti-sigma regulatory factor (Ser/Thr protein kinase) [Actinomadura namibiensis]